MYARLPHACVYMHIYAEISPPAVRKVILVSACMRTLATPESFQVCECKDIVFFNAKIVFFRVIQRVPDSPEEFLIPRPTRPTFENKKSIKQRYCLMLNP